jgi:micrococcal nuclease
MRLLIVLLVFVPLSSICQLKGRVVKVADGDTFTMLVREKQVRVRLHGIDCPEKGQDFANAAKQYLSGQIMGCEVTVKQMNTDRYGRIIGIVFLGTLNINEALLKEGLAWHFLKYDRNPEWTSMEATSRREKKGLWKQPDAVAPWQYRKGKRKVL